MQKKLLTATDAAGGVCANEPEVVSEGSTRSWNVFWAIFGEWKIVGLEEKYNNTFLETFKFSDQGAEFSERAGLQAHVWLNTPGV